MGLCGVPRAWQVMAELNWRSPWLMKQGLEVRMEGLGGLGIVIQGDGAGGTLDYQGKPWEEILHPPVSEAGDRRQYPLQWHRQEIFPGYRVKVGLL